jgi:hypothetical protein
MSDHPTDPDAAHPVTLVDNGNHVQMETEFWVEYAKRANAYKHRLEAAERERDAFREALRDICSPRRGHNTRDQLRETARGALTANEGGS